MKSNEIRANALNSITFHEIPKIVRNSQKNLKVHETDNYS